MNKYVYIFFVLIFILFFINYKSIKNYFHVHILMNIYSLISLINDKPIWLNYTNDDNLNKMKIITNKFNIKLKNIKVLDLGCGNCSMLDYFKNHSSNLYGVDISSINIYICKKKYKTNSNFQNTNIIDYLDKTTDNNFDLIIINGTLGYFTINQQIYIINKSYNKLKKNGYIYLGGIQYENDKNLWQTYPINNTVLKFLNKFDYKIYKEQDLFNENKYNTNNKLIIIKKS